MKLLTKEIIKKLEKYPYRSQDWKWWEALVIAKFFTPFSNWTWYVLEWDSEYDLKNGATTPETLYWIVSWFETEFWSFSLSELQSMADMWKVERDKWFPIGTKVSEVSELKDFYN